MEHFKHITAKVTIVFLMACITFFIDFRIQEDERDKPLQKEVIIKKIYLKPDTIVIHRCDTILKSHPDTLQNKRAERPSKQPEKKPDIKMYRRSRELYKKPSLA
ncbi:MAG: hypothetical protein NZ529_02815 [Cytophagaceae bacterium]|nr:hypothetical protein [Cytophagaceae bacterium]MDW8455703.1 hypothetical protein [Cytophagaceae bacterium]